MAVAEDLVSVCTTHDCGVCLNCEAAEMEQMLRTMHDDLACGGDPACWFGPMGRLFDKLDERRKREAEAAARLAQKGAPPTT